MLLALLLLLTTAAFSADVVGDLIVDVLRADNDAPIVGARVVVQDRLNLRAPVELVTDANGRARFEDLVLGEYYVDISHPDYGGDRALVKVNPSVDNVYKTMLDPAGQERVIKVREDRLLVNVKDPGDGAVTRRERPFLDRQVADSSSVQGILTTVPGTQRNSLGQTHARGEHKSVTFALDGVTVPITLASTTSQPLDPDFLEALDMKTGAYDASAGGQLGITINALTPTTREPYVLFRPKFGNLGQYEALLKAGGSNEEGSFSYFVGAKTGGTDLNFEAPHPDQQTLNNRGRNTSVLVRFQGKTDDDQVGVNFSYQNGLYQIPQTPENFAAGVRQGQEDTNTMGLLAWRHRFDEAREMLFGLALLRSTQSVNNNGVFTPFTVSPDPALAELGLPVDPQNPGSPYLPNTALVISQIQPSFTFTQRFGENHRLEAGFTADFIRSRQQVRLADPGMGFGIPNPTDPSQPAQLLTANIARNGFYGGVFVSHTVPLADWVVLNYGLRGDYFDNGINISTGQLSPVANLAFALSDTQSLRLSYNRVFQPPPLELDVSGNTFVLPQRVNAYELSYENQLDKHITAKLALVRKDYRDQVDIGLLVPNSNFPLFAPVNFGTAFYQGIEASLNTFNPTGWNGFLAATLSEARPLTPGPFAETVPYYNDHDQRLQTTFGASYTWENGFSAAFDCFYGSGFPQDALALYRSIGVYPYGITGDRVPRFLTNLSLNYFPREKSDGFEVGGGLQVLNLFDDRSLINFFSAFSGTRFNSQRRVMLHATLKW